MKRRPSELFISAILRGFRAETAAVHVCPAPANIWDRICMEAIRQPGAFDRLFEWDTRRSPQNRIGTISEVIKAGQVPGLTMGKDARGREIVCEVQP